MIVPLSFVARRVRLRPIGFLVQMVAIGSATGLIGSSSVLAALSQEESVQLALEDLPPGARAVEVISFHAPGEIRIGSPQERGLFAAVANVTDRPQRLLIGHPVAPSNDSGVRVIVPSALNRILALADGRYPATCGGGICEAVGVKGKFRVGQRVRLSERLTAVIVGLGEIQPAALADRSQLGRRAIVVGSLSRPIRTLLSAHGLNVTTTAPLLPEAVHGYALPQLIRELREGLVRVERSNYPGAPVSRATAPMGSLSSLAERGDVSSARLLLVAGQGAALVFAFAAFAVAARRPESDLVDEQLATFGALASQRMLARGVEVLAPCLLGVCLATGAVYSAAAVIADSRGLARPFVDAAVPGATVAIMFATALAAAGLLLFAAMPRGRTRLSVGAVEAAAAAALVAVIWQARSTGGLGPNDLNGGSAGPLLLVVPALAFFASGVVLLRLLPPALRLAERLSRRSSPALRLAILTAARRPALAASATTFLAVCLGSAIFSLNYRASLIQQAKDEAGFRSGALFRVVEHGASPQETSVAPLTRYTSVTSEPPTPALRLAATLVDALTGEQKAIELLGIPAKALPSLVGFRGDFSSLSQGAMAARLKERTVRLSGPRLNGQQVRLWARCRRAVPRLVVLHLLLPGQQFAELNLGVADGSWRKLSRPLPASMEGAELVGIGFVPISIPPEFDYDPEGYVDVAGLGIRAWHWTQLTALSQWEGAQSIDGVAPGIVNAARFPNRPIKTGVRFSFNGTTAPMIRPALDLPEALPALLGPTLQSESVDRLVTVSLPGLGTALPLEQVVTAKLFPTEVENPMSFAVVDYDTLFAVLNRDRPGVATPTEAWFFRPPKPGFVAHLSAAPFRIERVVSLDRTRSRLLHDPLGEGTSQLLLVSTIVAATLAALGLLLAAVAALNAERALAAEYEALGVSPKTLARSSRLRLLLISIVGVLAGFAGGIASLGLIAGLVAVTGAATEPLPPIRAVAAWLPALSVVCIAALATSLAVSLTGARTSATSVGRRLRG